MDKVEELVKELAKVDVKKCLKSTTTEAVVNILESQEVRDLMMTLINWEEYDTETGNDAIDVLASVKVLRYFLNLPIGYVTSNLMKLVQVFGKTVFCR